MKKIVLLIVSLGALALSGCQKYSESPRSAVEMRTWGNYKCVAEAPSGEKYTGWSVFEVKARKNALRICESKAENKACEISYCLDDKKD